MEEDLVRQAIEAMASHLVWAGVLIILANTAKDALVKVAAGIRFFFDPEFSVGDAVYVEGEPAEITTIGLFTTKFRIIPNGKCARYRLVHNDQLGSLRLEKPVKNKRQFD